MDDGKVVINAKRKVNGEWISIDIDEIDWDNVNEIHVKGKYHFIRNQWIPVTKEEMFKAGYEGREIRFRVDGRLFAIRELAQ